MKRTTTMLLPLFAACLVRMASAAALPTEITVQLIMTHDEYVEGERIRRRNRLSQAGRAGPLVRGAVPRS